MSRRNNSSSNPVRWVVLILMITVIGFLLAITIYQNKQNSPSANLPPVPALQWSSPPAMTIDTQKQYFATLQTDKGDIRIQLFADKSPRTVNNFVFLARAGFYDGVTFHRVLQDFMAQGGDPTGTGMGGPGYEFADELDPSLTFSEPGVVAMANSGPNTNGSQFFITFTPQTQLNGGYTIFGKVVDGMSVVLALKLRDPQQDPNYIGDAIRKVVIEETTTAMAPELIAPALLTSPTPQPGRPLAALALEAREDLFTTPPVLAIDLSRSYQAVLETTKGKIQMDLLDSEAPRGVNNFIVLANLGYWDHFPISRAQPGGWVFTGGGSSGRITNIGYSLPTESNQPDTAGAVGYCSGSQDADASGSAICILLRDHPALVGIFTGFGRVTEGLDVASTLTAMDQIETITIFEK
jgi:cyclophilin family peptidyl-prolyl cis-trans isomerase